MTDAPDDARPVDPLVDRAVRLFSFLGQAQQLRNPSVPDLDAYRRGDGAVHWLHELPDHPALHTALHGGTPSLDSPVLTIDRLPRLDPPEPEPVLSAWLDGPLDDHTRAPELRDRRYVEDPNHATADPAAPLQRTVLAIDEHPEVTAAYVRYRSQWAAWAEQERRDEPVRACYGELFGTHVSASGHAEQLEVVLGCGLLSWRPDGHAAVRRHLLTVPVTMTFDDDNGRITVGVDPSAEGSRVELEMLDPGLLGDPQVIHVVRERARTETVHPLDRQHSGELTRRLVHLLAPDAEYRDEDTPGPVTSRPVALFAPALILRKRSQQGLVEIFRNIVQQINASGTVPDGVRPLIDPDHVPDARSGADAERTDGAVVRVEEEPFLPLPVNETQLRILQQVDRHAQTLIQGPPGTGKTHTAAVLISHLLAQGKRVLVTAHTDRALKEVRGKLPEAVRPLAVSVVGATREDKSELRVAVERIGGMAADHDPAEAQRHIGEHLAAIDELRQRRAGLRHRLVEAREWEVREHEVAGYRGTPAAITRQLGEQRADYAWIATFDQPSGPPPLTTGEICRWHAQLLDTALQEDEPAAAQRLIELTELPQPALFAQLVDAEASTAQQAARYAGLYRHPAYAGVQRLDPAGRIALGERFRLLLGELQWLERRPEPWVRDALTDLRNVRPERWFARRAHLVELTERARPVFAALGPIIDVRVQGPLGGLDTLARPLLHLLSSGGQLKISADGLPKIAAWSPAAVKQAGPLFERVRVNGAAPTTSVQLTALLRWLEGQQLLEALDRTTAPAVAPPQLSPHDRLQWHLAELQLLDRVLALGSAIHHEQQRCAQLGLSPVNWHLPTETADYVALPDAVGAVEAATAAAHPLGELRHRLTEVQRWGDAEPVIGRLLAAVQRRDVASYAAGFARLGRLHRVRREVRERDTCGQRMTAAAPRLAASVLDEPTDPAWPGRLAGFERAWGWADARRWVDTTEHVDVDRLQREIIVTENEIRARVEKVAATRAWGHAVGRLSRGSRADLEQYVQLSNRFGKGTGVYREQRLAEMRDAMVRCRPSVPVWIMPIYRIADQLRTEPDMFDVVIVDEASQAGAEAAFLQYLAPRIVVIGDDKQVSPSAVGTDQQKLRDLARQYLFDNRHIASWQDPQRSLFDEARMRFSGMLTLTEHRRCVPEIINFSNRIAYEPDGVRLIPVRQFGPDRLEPIRPVLIDDGFTKGGPTHRSNPPEIDAIVDQIEKCIANPRYDGLTFGVISLLGATQAKAIEKKLLERVSPEEWTARDLRCGDAADFQGSERDVMFLSMVAAPEAGRRLTALTASMYVQRYNVAASRAKDQMWVFHSVPLEQLSNPEDMRFQLLDYCYGIQRRADADDDRIAALSLPEDERIGPFDSLFEQRVCNRVTDRGYNVVPQYPALGYSIDLVVVGAAARLAIECDGDHWHGPGAYQRDMARQRELERCGWSFFRVLESDFVRDPAGALAPLWEQLADLNIHPSGWIPPAEPLVSELPDASGDVTAHEAGVELEVSERSDIIPAVVPEPVDDESQLVPDSTPHAVARDQGDVELAPYPRFEGQLPPVPEASRAQLIEGVVRIVAVEGPILGHRLHTVYGRAAGHRMGPQIAKELNSAVSAAVRQGLLVQQDLLGATGVKPRTFRLPDQPAVALRELGPRVLEHVPPAELAEVMRRVGARVGWEDVDALYRATMGEFGIRRMGGTVRATLQAVVGLAREALPADGDAKHEGAGHDSTGDTERRLPRTPIMGDQLAVRVSCSASSSSLDACAFLVTAGGRVRSDADFIFYNQPVARDGSVRHIGTSTSGTMTTDGIDLDLGSIAPDIASVFLVVSVDGGVFADVQGLRIAAEARTGPIDFNFICPDPQGTAMIFAELCRSDEIWQFTETRLGNEEGLRGLARIVGVDVD